jgi:hypothetical protein
VADSALVRVCRFVLDAIALLTTGMQQQVLTDMDELECMLSNCIVRR